MANKIKYGLSNVYIAARNVSAQNVVTYGTPVALNGAVNLSISKVGGESNPFYADNIIYFDGVGSITGHEGTLEVALVPDWFKTGYLGYLTDDNNNLVETNKQGSPFALLFQVEGDTSATKYALFNVKATQDSMEYSTQEASAQPKSSTLNVTMTGESVSNRQCFIVECKQGDTNYNSFFNSVSLPTFTQSA